MTTTRRGIFAFSITIFFSLSNLSVFAANDIKAGEELSKPCAACHMSDGNSVNALWPKLAGQHVAYLSKQLRDFKEQRRNNVQMAPMVANLSEEDMDNLAAYYNSKKLKPGAADPDLISLGKRTYRAGNRDTGLAACMSCHAPNGVGNLGAHYPALAGQHAEYTATQLRAFRSGERYNDPNGIMRSVAKRMSDEEIDAVSAYIQGLRQ